MNSEVLIISVSARHFPLFLPSLTFIAFQISLIAISLIWFYSHCYVESLYRHDKTCRRPVLAARIVYLSSHFVRYTTALEAIEVSAENLHLHSQ